VKIRRVRPSIRLVAAAVLVGTAFAGHVGAFESGRASFALAVNDDLVIPYRVLAVYVLPGEQLRLKADGVSGSASAGELITTAAGTWQWTAPASPGLETVTFAASQDTIRLNVFVMHPAASVKDGQLNDYSIGAYPAPLRGDRIYLAPDGFIELNESNAEIELSPHFRLGQFPSKQAGDLPKYLVLREALLLKLELLLEHVNDSGITADAFTVMSGYRTPVYNRGIGNGQHSRHIYGGAADIYIDVAPNDGIMDDLNADGRLDFRDAQHLHRLAEELFSRPAHRHLQGGRGVYRSTPAHGPFLHIDARGVRARWGLIP